VQALSSNLSTTKRERERKERKKERKEGEKEGKKGRKEWKEGGREGRKRQPGRKMDKCKPQIICKVKRFSYPGK
jgi:hypothetical protein